MEKREMNIENISVSARLQTLLRDPLSTLDQGSAARRMTLSFNALVFIFSLIGYGALVGTFSGGIQYWAAPLKMVWGMLFSVLICLPSFLIFCCFSGNTVDLKRMLAALLASLALVGLLLMGFAPVAWVFQQSTESVPFMGFLHLVMYLLSLIGGFGVLIKAIKACEAKPSYLQVWCVIFVLVTLQVSCALRPLIGTEDSFFPQEKRFFLQHWLESIDQGGSGRLNIRAHRS